MGERSRRQRGLDMFGAHAQGASLAIEVFRNAQSFDPQRVRSERMRIRNGQYFHEDVTMGDDGQPILVETPLDTLIMQELGASGEGPDLATLVAVGVAGFEECYDDMLAEKHTEALDQLAALAAQRALGDPELALILERSKTIDPLHLFPGQVS